ncbi:MAG: radical SAM protein [Chloroflexi bacterium]|nr:radical SAM protein [Chloroflexota bacterium]
MMAETESNRKPGDMLTPRLQLIAWELTRSCNLFCAHCRGSAGQGKYPGELSTEECFHLIDEILEVGKPILILSGGEPLVREDVTQIGKYAVSKGLRVVMGSNGTLLTAEMAARLKEVPLSRIAISLDFPVPELQDNFRGQAGAFDAAIDGVTNARRVGIEVQINSTITKLNLPYLDDLLSLAIELGAVAYHPFLLVPTGRGKGLESVELSPAEYENTLHWIYDKQAELGDAMLFKPTCAPHFLRVTKQREKASHQIEPPAPPAGHPPLHSVTRGCLCGTGFCFISHLGEVKGCGYLDVVAGNIKDASFRQIWADSPLFGDLRNLSHIQGKCGVCEYKRICGGCRARAYEATGDYLEAEPYCVYQPALRKGLVDA